MKKLISKRWQRFCIIFIVAALAGIINGAVIFHLSHRYDYITEVISAISAMSPSNRTIVVEKSEYENFFANAMDYKIFADDAIPDSVESFWYILSPDSPKLKMSSVDDLVSGFHIISEIISDSYAAYELEKP